MSSQNVKVEIVNDSEIVIHKTITLKTNVKRMGKFLREGIWYDSENEEYEETSQINYNCTDEFKIHFQLIWDHETGNLLLYDFDNNTVNMINRKDINEIKNSINWREIYNKGANIW